MPFHRVATNVQKQERERERETGGGGPREAEGERKSERVKRGASESKRGTE